MRLATPAPRALKYFLPDSQDLVDPSFDFQQERRSPTRLRQRDDLYTHEVFKSQAIDGILVSKGIVHGHGGSGGRYTLAQRHRLLRAGAREFFRVHNAPAPLTIMGDCGAFTYVRESEPPYSVEEVTRFYDECDFDFGISVDHVILSYRAEWGLSGAPSELQNRQRLTLQLAQDFLALSRRSRARFVPLGVAQGWSPESYAHAVKQLQRIGYRYVAVGGMVPLKTHEVRASLEAISAVRRTDTQLHLLGVSRTDQMAAFAALGVTSFDSTSPLRQAFKDDKDNYYTLDRQFTAIRIPQVQGNPSLQRLILAGRIRQELARRLEQRALDAMSQFANGAASLVPTLRALREYEELYDPEANHSEAYRDVLELRPWTQCPCDICKSIGHHVILFRGAERNRRRGLHNVWVFYRRLQHELRHSDTAMPSDVIRRSASREIRT